MNKKVILIFILTIIALIVLTLFSFGPLANRRKAAKINPASLEPVKAQTADKGNASTSWNLYRNRDMRENYYGIQLPQEWNVGAGKRAGSYDVNFFGGKGTIVLIDVPDNSTLELFILSQQEPQLKITIPGYSRIDYKKLSIQGNEAYQLTYQSKTDNGNFETLKTYIAGADQAIVLTFIVNQASFNQALPLLNSVVRNFRWENQ